jgi:S-methylmethionine-dependent homocysteine/selenocysteine methylase
MDPAYYPGPDRELTDLQELANLLADSGVDLIALEMMEDSDHARRAMEAALETGLPVWLGVSCRRRAGGLGLTSFDYPHIDFSRPLDALIPMGPAVVNIMHSEISAVGPAMEMVRQRWSGPIGAYPEVGDFTANGSNADPQPTPEHLVRHAQTWVSCGARLIGGCCGTTPAHIRALREAFSH